jgi:hypothetical protein
VSKQYNWLVVRGKVAIANEGTKILLDLGPEGSSYCVLSTQDALDISGILTDEAKNIWESSNKANGKSAIVKGDVHSACQLTTNTGELKIVIHDSDPLLAMVFSAMSTCEMDLEQTIALVQILKYMTEAMAARAT